MRSKDGGYTWQPINAGMDPPAYTLGDARLVSGPGVLYLYYAGYGDTWLYRTADGGDTWQRAGSQGLQGTTALAVAPDGRLWFGLSQGGVRPAAPGDFAWAPVVPGGK